MHENGMLSIMEVEGDTVVAINTATGENVFLSAGFIGFEVYPGDIYPYEMLKYAIIG